VKYAWTLAALAVATLVVLLVLDRRDRVPPQRAPVAAEAVERHPSKASSGKASPADQTNAGEQREVLPDDAPRGAERLVSQGRVVYEDGAPSVGIVLNLAVARPLKTRVWRNGDYPAKTIWLVTLVVSTQTGPNGEFSFPPVAMAARTLRWLYTYRDSPAFVLQQYAAEVRAARRVKISGALRDANGEFKEFYPFGAQLGQPEDYQTRVAEEYDSFVSEHMDMRLDPQARTESETTEDGRFELQLVSGRNTFFFGEGREDGTLDIVVPNRDANLGDITIPPKQMAKPPVPRPVHGLVVNVAGQPHAGAEVRLWAGTVGAPSHVGRTNAKGEFRFERIESEQAVLWAISRSRPHVILPEQCSGIVRLPCNTPVVLRAPHPDEYYWMTPQVRGFFLFVREGVFLDRSGGRLDPPDEVGLPVGRYHIAVVNGHSILEGPLVVKKGGEGVLRWEDLTDTTWQQ
jgi:hypothetical protein